MPSASNNNQSNTKLVKQTSVNSVNSGGASGTSGSVKGNKKITEGTTKLTINANATTTVINNETSSIKSAKENTNNVVAAQQQQQNSKNWETSSASGNANAISSSLSKDAGNDALNPMKLTFTMIEHKIRNLEKRKTKLEGYRAIQASGKELSADQRAAVAKYDAVMATLEFARDLVKQMQQFTKDAEKEQKKQARKELIAKAQAETIKIREVLIIQNILSCFTDDAVRNDFLSGENGAAKLEPSEFEIMEKFCWDVQTRRPETSEDVPFATSAQKAAEIFSMTIDARPKQYGETTYENVKRIFHRIQESDYLDKIYLTDVPEPEIKTADEEVEQETVANNEDAIVDVNNQEQELNAVEDGMDNLNIEAAAVNLAPTQVHDAPAVDNVTLISQQQQPQPIIKEHLDLQQQQQQVAAISNLQPQTGQQVMNAPMAPPATAVPPFQPPAAASHSGTTTPVHVAMYHPSMQQPTPQMQQIPNAANLIAGVHTNSAGQIIPGLAAQQQAVVQNVNGPPGNQQQRQMLTSPAGQPGIPGAPIAMHNANPQPQPPPPGHFNPCPVHAVEQTFFKHQQPPHNPQPPQQQQQQQYLQQMRPLAEVIGSGNFYFLQDSELDSPDLNNQGVQGVPQNTIIFEQQQQQLNQQNLPQNKTTQNMTEQNANATQQQLQQQLNQQLPLTQQQQNSTQTPIQTQTFTNQSFPQIQPQQQQPQQQASQNPGLMQSNTPSPLFQQQTPLQQQHLRVNNTNSQQIFTPVATQNLTTPQQHQQQQSQLIMAAGNDTQQLQQQPPPASLMIMNRLAAAAAPSTPLMQQQQQGLMQQQQQQQITPQNHNIVAGMQQQLPPNSATASDMSQTPKNASFPFDSPVVAGLSYEQQMQNKINTEKVLNALQEANNVASASQLHKNDLINEWDEAVLKGNNSSSTNNQQDYKSASTVQDSNSSTKWSAEVNANSPITVQHNQSRKNEWTSSSNSNSNSVNAGESNAGGYANDNRAESNHWHSQDSNSYGRGNSGGNRGQGGGANSGGYQRQRSDDRRDDRRPGGGGGYRGRSNYGSGNPQQNGQTRGGGGGGNTSGIYFRNNENASSNSYYQNGSGGSSNVYSNKDSRYESRGGGGNYRGPRGSDNSGRSNGPPPRHMGNRSSGGGNSNTNSNSYMNSRQSSNRMPLGIENKN